MFAIKLNVGDEVGFGRYSRMGSMHSTGVATVIKINGHGHIYLSTGTVFDKNGNQRKTSFEHGLCLCDAAALRANIAQDEAARTRRVLVKSIIAKLEGSVMYSGTVHIDAAQKADLVAMVNAL